MERDAAGAGVAPIGGLFSTAEIKILICYVLTELQEPVPCESLVNLLHYEEIANGFEVSDALHSLENSGMIVSVKDDDEDCYQITEQGKSINATLNDSLPNTVKRRSLNAAKKMAARRRNAKNSDIQLTHEDGATYITCTALDGSRPLLSVKMLVTDDAMGNRIKNKFLEASPEICTAVIDLLTKESE